MTASAVLIVCLCAIFVSLLQTCVAYSDLIACCGDSITYGSGATRKEKSTYPAMLGHYLSSHSNYTVMNFGMSGATATKQLNKTYSKTSYYRNAIASNPQIVILMLGTNDAKVDYWNPTKYEDDYVDLILSFKNLPSHPQIYVCIPPPMYSSTAVYDIQPEVVNRELPKIIPSVAKRTGAQVIDLFAELGGNPGGNMLTFTKMFAVVDPTKPLVNPNDGVHPNDIGYVLMARYIAAKILHKTLHHSNSHRHDSVDPTRGIPAAPPIIAEDEFNKQEQLKSQLFPGGGMNTAGTSATTITSSSPSSSSSSTVASSTSSSTSNTLGASTGASGASTYGVPMNGYSAGAVGTVPSTPTTPTQQYAIPSSTDAANAYSTTSSSSSSSSSTVAAEGATEAAEVVGTTETSTSNTLGASTGASGAGTYGVPTNGYSAGAVGTVPSTPSTPTQQYAIPSSTDAANTYTAAAGNTGSIDTNTAQTEQGTLDNEVSGTPDPETDAEESGGHMRRHHPGLGAEEEAKEEKQEEILDVMMGAGRRNLR